MTDRKPLGEMTLDEIVSEIGNSIKDKNETDKRVRLLKDVEKNLPNLTIPFDVAIEMPRSDSKNKNVTFWVMAQINGEVIKSSRSVSLAEWENERYDLIKKAWADCIFDMLYGRIAEATMLAYAETNRARGKK